MPGMRLAKGHPLPAARRHQGAAAYNFLLVASLPAVALLLVGELVRKRRPGFYAAVNNTKFTAGVLLAVTGWWILRNIMGW